MKSVQARLHYEARKRTKKKDNSYLQSQTFTVAAKHSSCKDQLVFFIRFPERKKKCVLNNNPASPTCFFVKNR